MIASGVCHRIIVTGQHDAGVVEEDVEPAELGFCRRDHGLDFDGPGDVDPNPDRSPAGVEDLLHRCLVGIVGHISGDDRCALSCEPKSCRPANSATCTGDDRHFVLEPLCHVTPP